MLQEMKHTQSTPMQLEPFLRPKPITHWIYVTYTCYRWGNVRLVSL